MADADASSTQSPPVDAAAAAVEVVRPSREELKVHALAPRHATVRVLSSEFGNCAGGFPVAD